MIIEQWFIMSFCGGLTWYLIRREERHYKVIQALEKAINNLQQVISTCPKRKK